MKMNNILKILFLLVAIVATYALILIAQGLSYNRYTFTGTNAFDAKTKKVYYFIDNGKIMEIDEKGKWKYLKELPE